MDKFQTGICPVQKKIGDKLREKRKKKVISFSQLEREVREMLNLLFLLYPSVLDT